MPDISGNLKNKVALVTGGSRGIGEAIVRRLARDGAIVYFTYLTSEEKAKAVVASLTKTAKVCCLPCDVRKNEDAVGVIDRVLDAEGRIDILVNNAGVIRDGLFLALSEEDWQEVLATNLGGVVHFSQNVLRPMMMQGWGRIINISSIVGELGGVGQANYAASKAAVNALTKSMAAEYAAKNITVNAVAPGLVETEMTGAVRAAFGSQIKERIPAGSFAKPEEVAAVAAFLATDEARYITGQVIAVDGGLSLLSRR
jgi:3-oxoacyl-[acyl-carrier protein] reductase